MVSHVEPQRSVEEPPKPASVPAATSTALPQPTSGDGLRVAEETASAQAQQEGAEPDEEPFELPLPVQAPVAIERPVPAQVHRPAPAPIQRPTPVPASGHSVGTDWDRLVQDGAPVGGAEWRKPVVRPVAESGWRRWLYFASAKTLNLGENPADISARELDRKLQTPLEREFSIGVVQLKGGAAKTTTALGIGNAFAEARTDAVVAIDVNPDRGNMARRTELRTDSNVFTLIAGQRPTRVQEVRVHTNQTPAGLEVLASAQDPAAAQSFSEQDYAEACGILRDFYSLIISDCGTNITHSATQAVLAGADALVIPLDARSDSADEAVATIDYLHGAYAKDPLTNQAIVDGQGNRQWLYRHLLARTVVVISHQRPGRRMFDVDNSLAWFRERVMDVHVIPYDPHLEESGEIIPDRLNAATKQAYRELAAKLAGTFPSTYSADSHLRRAV
ncbi:AAA family ATPase [Rhodococcus hoagii]|nr:AAA family ATPase [Prescottella equi]NKS10256.1 AAA family ATPase [Prescottella equi]NKS35247.1 AAA family ATPase [Prescottella equi]NKS62094.1 AAA family ATPase [Prescottella equi]NKS68236.1 AAA family ATPase [Prescottella equi]